MSNQSRISLLREHVLLRYFMTLSVGPVGDLNSFPPARQSGDLQRELTKLGVCI